MILKTKEFQEAANTILMAASADKSTGSLELVTKENALYLNVANQEYYVSQKFPLETSEEFRVVVDAHLFLNLISGITTEEIELISDNNVLVVKAGKSKYKLPMIYDNDKLMELPRIEIMNKTVEMPIANSILKSILNVNSKELQKVKNIDVDELKRLYYIDNTCCFTYTTGACLNSFSLEKPVKFLLNDRIVKLFKLFDDDVNFTLGHDTDEAGNILTKVIFETENTYLVAITPSNDVLLSKIAGPCNATKNFINEQYTNHVVLSVSSLIAAAARLLMFTKNSAVKTNMLFVPVTTNITSEEITFTDNSGNSEVVTVDNKSNVMTNYEMYINLADLKLALDSCKSDYVTLNCGNHKSVVLSYGTVNSLISEGTKN